MAQFYIQTDKDQYFAGQTVNGQVLINVQTMIGGATGISLKFTGYECVKWVDATELHRPQPNPNRDPKLPPPRDPIAEIPPNQIYRTDEPIAVSDVESEDDKSYDHRPKYIRTSNDRYFKMAYYQTRNMFTKNFTMIHQCNGFAPGQYSFPFSFKTFQGWPASFEHIQQRKKGKIIYHLTAAIQPQSKQFQLKNARQITICETRNVSTKSVQRQGNIKYCCCPCCDKGNCTINCHFQKDGYMPGEMVQLVCQIDNSQCSAEISKIAISVTNQVTMKSSGKSTGSSGTVFSRTIDGIPANQKATHDKAIIDSFMLESQGQIKPTCSGKLLSNNYHLNVNLVHQVGCDCCKTGIGASIPIIIFPRVYTYNKPQTFQQNWNPQQMQMVNMQLSNSFGNPNITNMSGMGGMGGGGGMMPQYGGNVQGGYMGQQSFNQFHQ